MLNLNRKTSDGCGLTLGNDHSVFELSHESLRLLGQNGIRNQELVLETFLDSDTGRNRILERVDAEAERRIVVQDFVEELPALLDLEVVGTVHRSFEDSAAEISLFGFSFSRTDIDVQGEYVVNSEFLRLNSLLEGLLVDDYFVSVDQVLLQFVRKDTFQGRNLIRVSDLLDHSSHFVVGVSRLD